MANFISGHRSLGYCDVLFPLHCSECSKLQPAQRRYQRNSSLLPGSHPISSTLTPSADADLSNQTSPQCAALTTGSANVPQEHGSGHLRDLKRSQLCHPPRVGLASVSILHLPMTKSRSPPLTPSSVARRLGRKERCGHL